MAKNRTDVGEAIERADDGHDERELLRSRIAELEAENATLKATPAPAAAPAPIAEPMGPARKWRGFVKHGVAIIVEAANEVYAEREYIRVAGIIHTEHKIEIEPAADDTVLGPVKVTN
jgi:hypothetical protein